MLLRGWGTPEGRALRDMSLSASVMVRGGTPEGRALRDMSLSVGVMVRRGTPDQKFFGNCP